MNLLSIPKQLSLPIYSSKDETFASFYPGENQQLLEAMHVCLLQPGSYLYFWASGSAGRTHLLRAACSALSQKGAAVSYLPLEKKISLRTEVLEGMENLALVCLDNIDTVAGDRQWELALFDLYNRLYERGETRLLITANSTPCQLNMTLPDLTSRLDWGTLYKLQPLRDEEKLQALKMRARLRGLELPEEVGRFLLKRLKRDLRTLFMALNHLDHASIVAHRKLTIPFVKSILAL